MEQQKRDIDALAAVWHILDNHPFSMFESTSRKKFLQALHVAYKPPLRKLISSPLLNKQMNVIAAPSGFEITFSLFQMETYHASTVL